MIYFLISVLHLFLFISRWKTNSNQNHSSREILLRRCYQSYRSINFLFIDRILKIYQIISTYLGHGRFHMLVLVVCGIGMMCVVIENVNIGFVLPYIRCEMKISTKEQGVLNSVGYLGIVISSHFWGFLAGIPIS